MAEMAALAQMTLGQRGLAVLIILTCCFLMLVILLQRGRGEGLSGAFGGGGGSGAFGAKTGDVFTWVTVTVATLFLLLAVVSNYAFDKSEAPRRDRGSTSETASDEAETDAEAPESGAVAPEGDAEALPPITVESETSPPAGGEIAPAGEDASKGEPAGTEGKESNGGPTDPGHVPPPSDKDEVPPSP